MQPGGAPGEFRVWAMVGDQMFGVPLRVPRKLYVVATDAGSG